MNEINTLFRSFPKMKNHNFRYPLEYVNHKMETKKIITPFCNLGCETKCYMDLEEYQRRKKETKCRICGNIINQKENFVDIGLAEVIFKYAKTIKEFNYIEVEVDPQKQLISWQASKTKSLVANLAQIVTDDYFLTEYDKSTKNLENINYHNAKKIIKKKFNGISDFFKPEIITWCRGNLKSDESFSGLILMIGSKSFHFINICDQNANVIQLDNKNTHVHYIPNLTTFIFLISETEKKRIVVKAANVHKHLSGITKLILKTSKKPLDLRNWYSSTYDYSKQEIFLLGGLDDKREGISSVQKLNQFQWIEDDFQFNRQNIYTYDTKICSSIINTKMEKRDSTTLVVLGGVTFKRNYSFETKQPYHEFCRIKFDTKKLSLCGDKYPDKIASYTHIIQIPLAKNYNNECEVLIFGGTDDYQNDDTARRNKYKKINVFNAGDEEFQEVGECPNNNMPYLNQNTSALVQDEAKKLIIKMLVPARDSKTKVPQAYLIEYSIKEKKAVTTVINVDLIKKN